MPKQSAVLLEAVEQYLDGLPGNVRPLGTSDLAAYPRRNAVRGWRLNVHFSDRQRRLDLLLDKSFPRTPVSVMLVDRPAFLDWPHVEDDGKLCLVPNMAEVDPSNPAGMFANQLGAACALVEDSIAGRTVEDFRREFATYWDWRAKCDGRALRSLLDPLGPSRPVRLWQGKRFRLVGESDAAITHWLSGVRSIGADEIARTSPALLLRIERPLFPLEYPQSGADLERLAIAVGAVDLLHELVRSEKELAIILAAPGEEGTCLVGVMVPALQYARNQQTGRINGFRPGKAPARLVQLARLGGTVVRRVGVQRVDARWIHGRDADPRAAALQGRCAAIIGCGSIGAQVAMALAQAGVGRLILIDPELLVAANIGRHVLGAEYIGVAKATALAARIRASLPHVDVEARISDWQAVADSEPALLAADLVVSAIGSWADEGALDAWRRAATLSPAVLYGWTEAHAVGGHAVALFGDGCLACGLSQLGEPVLRVANWPRATARREAGCGSFYQPYGPVDLMNVNAMIADLALDCLLGTVEHSTHRIWAAGQAAITRAGATWTVEFRKIAPVATGLGAFTIERDWPTSATCHECGRTMAA